MPSTSSSTRTSRRAAPPAERIVDRLRQRIVRRQWQAGEKIASEHTLSREFGVCRATITKALKELEREGLLVGQQGRGRFVADENLRQRTGCIGLIISHLDRLTHPIMQSYFAGLRDVLQDAGCHLRLTAFNAGLDTATAQRRRHWLRLIDPQGLDGIIVGTRELPQPLVEELVAVTRVVRLLDDDMGADIASVNYDMVGASAAAARHLLDLGHRRLAVLTIPTTFAQGRLQHEGAAQAVAQVSNAALRLLVAERNRAEHALTALGSLLNQRQRPTAIICGSDELLQGVWRAAQDAGLRVPEDLSLTGWNDTLTLQDLPLALTTVQVDSAEVARQAARCLLSMIGPNPQPPQHLILPARFIVRDSTAAPRVESR